jgi:predicted O-methyltransferase YrrM
MIYKKSDGLVVRMQQLSGVHEPISLLFKKVRPSQIVEIGTAAGGFTHLVREELNKLNLEQSKILTIDKRSIAQKKFEEKNMTPLVGNCFTEDGDNFIDEIKNLVQLNGTSIIFCDGGNKIKEFYAGASILKRGDIILSHDYFKNKEIFQKDFVETQKWFWCSTIKKDLEEAHQKYGLQEFMAQEFAPYVWSCAKKMT